MAFTRYHNIAGATAVTTELIKSGSNTPISINPVGIIRFDNYQYTPPVVEGGLLYSGSEFYLGLE